MGLGLPRFDAATEQRFDEWRSAHLRDALPGPILIGALALLGFAAWDYALKPELFMQCFLVRGLAGLVMAASAWRIRQEPPLPLTPVAMLIVTMATSSIIITQHWLPDGFVYGTAGLALFPIVSAIIVPRASLVPLVNLPSTLVLAAILYLHGLSGFALLNVVAFFGTGIFSAFILAHTLERTAREGFELQLRLEEQARLDPLTGIANRRRLEERATLEVERAQRFKRDLSLLILDIDHFKGINDRYGHMFGDEVLRHVAQIGQQSLRRIDLFARVGGEEFVALLPETGPDAAMILAERLRVNLETAVVSDGVSSLSPTVSIGIANLGPGRDNLETMLAAADRALYIAKASGRNQVISAEGPDNTKKIAPLEA
jgi:diguanylate cyclase (GGDEF)-like protein